MTPRCQLLSLYTALPHLVGISGADAARGLSAHNRLQTNADVLLAACGQQFNHGEVRLQQWSIRHSHRASVHAQCVNGGVAHDHDLHQKQPTDQDAVETVVVKRDCVIQAAGDSEVLLPLAPDSAQASTAAAADDDQTLFGS